jgi:hypothetical protein
MTLFGFGPLTKSMVVILGLQSLIAVGARSKEALVAFEERIDRIQGVGSLVMVSLENGDVAVCDGDGRILAVNSVGLEDDQFAILIPSDSLLVVVSNKWYSENSVVDRLSRLFSNKSHFDLYRFGDSVELSSTAFDGDLGRLAYDAASDLLAFCTLLNGQERLLVYSLGQDRILDEMDIVGDALNMAFEDSVIYVVGSEMVNRYRLNADGRVARLETVVLPCNLNQFFVFDCYSGDRKRLLAYNDCLDSTIGPIRLNKFDSLVSAIEELVPHQLTDESTDAAFWRWSCVYKYSTRELFANDMGKMLYVDESNGSRLMKYSLGELRTIGIVNAVIPLEDGRYVLLPFKPGQPCSQFWITDSLGSLNSAQ